MFRPYQHDPTAILYSTVEGVPCLKLQAGLHTDMTGSRVPARKRAQVFLGHIKRDEPFRLRFSLCLPHDWDDTRGFGNPDSAVGLLAFHNVKVVGSVAAMYADGRTYRFDHYASDVTGPSYSFRPLRPGVWETFEIRGRTSQLTGSEYPGFLEVLVNGEKWFKRVGNMIATGDTHVYVQLGLDTRTTVASSQGTLTAGLQLHEANWSDLP